MELSKTIIIDPGNLNDFVKALAGEVKGIMASEKREYEQYLNTTELSKLFPFSRVWFTEKINQGLFGKKGKKWRVYGKVQRSRKISFRIKNMILIITPLGELALTDGKDYFIIQGIDFKKGKPHFTSLDFNNHGK